MNLIYLLKKDLHEGRKAISIYGLTILIVMVLSRVLALLVNGPYVYASEVSSYLDLFISFLFIGGFIIASIAFRDELYGRTTQHNWLMLPASPLEKLAVQLLIVLVLYPLALLLFVTAASVVTEGLTALLFGTSFAPFRPFDRIAWTSILNFIVLGSVFLMGSAYFRKAAFMKTVLTLGLLGVFFSLVAAAAGRVIFSELITDLMISERMFGVRTPSPSYLSSTYPVLRFFAIFTKVSYWGLLAPFCWLVSYFRIREVQAYDAV
jgi:hypothetical protein